MPRSTATGVSHGDVHPGNLLIGRDGAVHLLDFGLAEIAGPSLRRSRGRGELLRPAGDGGAPARRSSSTPGRSGASSSPLLRCSTSWRRPSTTWISICSKDEMLRQIKDDPPLPFAERGADLGRR